MDRRKFKSWFRVTMGKFPSLSFFLCKRTITHFLSLLTFHSLVSKCEEITFHIVPNSLIHNSLQLWIITPTDLAIVLVVRIPVLCNRYTAHLEAAVYDLIQVYADNLPCPQFVLFCYFINIILFLLENNCCTMLC